MNKNNKKSSALLFALLAVAVLTILGAAFVSRSISESQLAQRNLEFTKAFWLAEAGVNYALGELRLYPYLAIGTIEGTDKYRFTLVNKTTIPRSDGYTVDRYTIKAEGCMPSGCNFSPTSCHIIRALEVVFTEYEYTPDDFFGYAIYSAGNVTIGSNCSVTGNVISGDTINGTVNGVPTENNPDLRANGLPMLNFTELEQTSIEQGWYVKASGKTTYPDSFYNELPSAEHPWGIPNVVFVNGDFSIVGGKEVVKGFVVVGGDTVYNAEIGGNASVDGCVYTRGNIWFHGGGGPAILNVNGGVWAGGTVLMNGNEEIKYNKNYMDAIRYGLEPNTDIKITAWEDTQNPYAVFP